MTAVFRTYLDESSNEPQGGKIFAVGGFVATAQTWNDLEPLWLQILPPAISYFHATDCFGGRGDFRNIDIPERVSLLDRLTDLITQHDMRMVCAGIDTVAYQEVAPKPKENEFLTNKFVASLELATEILCSCLYTDPPWPVPVNKEQCDFFIEDSDKFGESGRRTFYRMKRDEYARYREMLGTDSWGCKEGNGGIALLQVADLAAFLGAKKIANDPNGKIGWQRYFEKLRDAGRVFRLDHITESGVKVLYQLHRDLTQP